MFYLLILGLALVPATLTATAEPKQQQSPKQQQERDPSLLLRSLLWGAAFSLAVGYWCAITGLKAWAGIRSAATSPYAM